MGFSERVSECAYAAPYVVFPNVRAPAAGCKTGWERGISCFWLASGVLGEQLVFQDGCGAGVRFLRRCHPTIGNASSSTLYSVSSLQNSPASVTFADWRKRHALTAGHRTLLGILSRRKSRDAILTRTRVGPGCGRTGDLLPPA